jgi:hypothetical protein
MKRGKKEAKRKRKKKKEKESLKIGSDVAQIYDGIYTERERDVYIIALDSWLKILELATDLELSDELGRE